MEKKVLDRNQIASAVDIQRAIDRLGSTGGTIQLPEMDLVIDRGIELRSGVEISGCGRKTILRNMPGRVYPLNGHQIFGMYDLSLVDTEGLVPGMTVAIHDDMFGDFFETFARITWVDEKRVGLDQPLASDYGEPGSNPRLITSFPLIFGSHVQNAAVKNLALDGSRCEQAEGIGGCRGAALFFIYSSDCMVEAVQETSFPGEGLAFQMCRQMHIEECSFVDNAGNGYHPGAGSTGAVFRSCVADDNGRCGFYFCARANRIDVENCQFQRNREAGMSIGILDCHNRIIGCDISDNNGPGVLFRPEVHPTEVHSCEISECTIEGNRGADIKGQIEIRGDAHDLIIADNRISGVQGAQTAGISVGGDCKRIFLQANRIEACAPEIDADPHSLIWERPRISAGIDSVHSKHFHHLYPHVRVTSS